MAKKQVPGTGSSAGRAPSKQVPVAPKPASKPIPPGQRNMGKGGGGKRGC